MERQKIAASIPQLEDVVYKLDCLQWNLEGTRYAELLPEIRDCLHTLRVIKVKVVPLP